MRKYIYDTYQSVMGWNKNPLRHIQDFNARHFVTQILAWMWCIVFSMLVGSWSVFGYTAVAHFVFLIAVFLTVATFETAKRRPEFFHTAQKTLNYEKIQGKYEDIW